MFYGALAQLVAHDTGSVGVTSSSLVRSTKKEDMRKLVLFFGLMYVGKNIYKLIYIVLQSEDFCLWNENLTLVYMLDNSMTKIVTYQYLFKVFLAIINLDIFK